MPAVSKAQFRLMEECANGGTCPPGLSRKQAQEYVRGQSPKGLPEKKKPTKKSGK